MGIALSIMITLLSGYVLFGSVFAVWAYIDMSMDDTITSKRRRSEALKIGFTWLRHYRF